MSAPDQADLVTYAVMDGVARIELNRPTSANVFDLDTTRAFAAHVQRAAEEGGVRAVLVTGAGPRFCGGGDVASFPRRRTNRRTSTNWRWSWLAPWALSQTLRSLSLRRCMVRWQAPACL
jgi:enoyl-CoA hydratase/carnithine racemase